MHIRRNCFVSLLGVLFIVFPSFTAQADSNQILESVVRIYSTSVDRQTTLRGTGVVVEGGVITAAHVVDKGDLINVTTGDGDDSITYDADVVFSDSMRDLAFLKVRGAVGQVINLKPAKFNTSFPVQPGTDVYAIGNSLGFTRTVSKGIVSASGTRNKEKFLFSDVLVRKGNSGGPLVNGAGEIIALVLGTVDTSIVGQSMTKDSSPEFTYTVPAADIVEFLGTKGILPMGYLGVMGETVATGYGGYDADKGLKITKITRECGLNMGDVVMWIGDDQITSIRDLARSVRKLQPGSKINSAILRDGLFKQVELSVGSTPK